MQKQEPPKAPFSLSGLAECVASPLKVLCRSPPMGSRYVGANLVVGMGVQFLVVAQGNRVELAIFMGLLTLAMGFGHCFTGHDRRGVHSRYDGLPIACKWFGADEVKARSKWEPLMLLALAACLLPVAPSISAWVCVANAASHVSLFHWKAANKARVRAMADARAEAAVLRDAFVSLDERRY